MSGVEEQEEWEQAMRAKFAEEAIDVDANLRNFKPAACEAEQLRKAPKAKKETEALVAGAAELPEQASAQSFGCRVLGLLWVGDLEHLGS